MSNVWLITNQQSGVPLLLPWDSLTTFLALWVRTPSDHSLVSMSICPNNCCLGMALGFIVYCFTYQTKKKVNRQGTQGRISLILKMSLFIIFNMLNNTGTQTVHNVILEYLYYITFSSYSIKFKRGGSPSTHHFSCLAESRPEHPPQCGLACSAWPDNNYAHTLS